MKTSIVYTSTVLALATVLAISLPTISTAAGPIPTAPGQNKFLCLDGTTDGSGLYGGICTLTSNGAKGPATLDNTSLVVVNAEYAAVYTENTTLTGQTFDNVTQLGYRYVGPVPKLGNLSLILPVSTDGDDVNDLYLFIDTFRCAGIDGVVNVINDPNCGIVEDRFAHTLYPNWAALVAAHPDWKIGGTGGTGSDPVGTRSFLIAKLSSDEGPAFWTVSNITIGKPGK